nr:MAG TPA: hypothetical protein [Caudoviricetes sp.]
MRLSIIQPLYTIFLMWYDNIVSKNIQLHRKWRN